jgi:hypothetical protein
MNRDSIANRKNGDAAPVENVPVELARIVSMIGLP